MLEIDRSHWSKMLASALEEYPLEGCGLLIGRPGSDRVVRFVPIRNELRSPRAYQLDGSQYVAAAGAADDEGLDIIGIVHSHPSTEAYPSDTDVAGATTALVPPSWHWVIIGLSGESPEVRSFRISGTGIVEEEPIEILG